MSLIIPTSSDGGVTTDVTIAAQDAPLDVNATIVGQPLDVNATIVGQPLDVNAFVTNTLEEIPRGTVTGSSPIAVYGEFVASGAATDHVIWNNGAYTVPSASGVQMTVVSDSVDDDSAGTGIRTLKIYYLDNALAPQTETVTMDGTTGVTTVATNIRFINNIVMLTYGSGKAAAGNITVSNGGTTYGYIAIGHKTSNSSAYMVPVGKRLMISGLSAGSSSGSSDAKVIVKIAVSNYAGVDYSTDSIFIPLAAIALQDSSESLTLNVPFALTEGVIFTMLATTDKSATIVGSWFGWLENV
jgi:hypothetical protein